VEFKDIIESAIAVVAVVISAVALVRTRRFEAKQIAFQKTADRLTRLQTEILERDENERLTRQRQAEVDLALETRERAEAFRREAEAAARGSMTVYWSSTFGEERLNIRNDGQVPVRDVRLIPALASGELPALMLHDLGERLPVSVLKPGEETFVRAKGLPRDEAKIHMRIEWSTDSGRFFMEANRRDLYAYKTEIRRMPAR
jgi:hypothetical protein